MEPVVQSEELNTEKKTTKQKVIFGLKIAGNVVFYAIIFALLIFSIMNIRSGKDNFPNIFGKGFLAVVSDSMERSPNGNNPAEWKDYSIGEIKKGDLLYANVYGGDINGLKVGDVITYYDGKLEALNSHRIVYINVENKYVVTQGDKIAQVNAFDKANPMSDHNGSLEAFGYVEHVSNNQIKGVVTGINGGAGNVLVNIQKNWLFYFVIPIAIILLIEVFFVFKNILDLKNAKGRKDIENDKEAMKAELEAEREKMRAEILAELKEQTANTEAKVVEDATPTEDAVEETKEESLDEEKKEVTEEPQKEE